MQRAFGVSFTWNVRFDEKIVEHKDPDIPIGYDENMVLEEVEKAIKLYEENKDLDNGNMEVSEDEELLHVPVWPPFKRLCSTRT